ncbi:MULTISPECIES: hypothetical protein [unclassified Sphingomonas]|mgnify:CR=1 FL=1|uniref:hypothetical protein n=1 Tax=unclassified Sphingomonas TaxID=196159 RepID=UPI0009264CE5|nr:MULTISPECIES: hypothetical protein [unclassified Sphingomonas]OJU21786.1 MAG: hypothetical protein BGN95_09010 [Sphingomonas sp. 66-10]
MPLVGALLIAACAPTVRPFGDAPPPAAAQPPFSIGETRRADVADAVRDALHAAGYREAQDAPTRVEIGFAIRPPGVTVAGAGGATIVSPPAPRAIGLCRRQAYVLILAMIDRASGTVLRRSGAITARCVGKEATLLPALARAAVSPRR